MLFSACISGLMGLTGSFRAGSRENVQTLMQQGGETDVGPCQAPARQEKGEERSEVLG
jgi:hypothetical protein